MSVIGTSSSSSTEAWLVHPEPDTWLALSASTTTLGLVGVSLAASGEESAGGVVEDEAEAMAGEGAVAASGADEELEGASAAAAAAAASGASGAAASLTSLWGRIFEELSLSTVF